ncbi:hypothetical protein V6U81_02690 [Micromonospora sp. CPCC 205711]|uniref:hypothetical protein n=1 Tax=Micromonospora sp. CPCC 205547 TaxID=3122400 RepID=UPI002FF045D9
MGDRYFPTAHVHALTRKFPVVTMTLGQRLSGASGVQESVGFDEHGEVFRQAADRLREQSWLSLAEPPALEDVVSVYQGYVRRQMELGHPPAVNEAEDCVLLPAAAGLPKLAERSLAIVEEVSANWPSARLPLNWSSRQEWLTELAGKAKNHAELTACVESQIAYHKLDKIPTV